MKKISGLGLLVLLSQTSCIVAGGYSSDGGWYIWPGSFVAIVVVVIAFLLLRRRR
ncbi:MAG TPA: hypothetical protein VEW46_18170 [Pyrinomonadaceae bacterium]|nr:hypothetical protein [Pyrinomonadaceae bacterium]